MSQGIEFYLKRNCTIELEGQASETVAVVVNTGQNRRRLNEGEGTGEEGEPNLEGIASAFAVAVEDVAVRGTVRVGESDMYTVVLMAAPNAVDPTTGLTALETLK